MSGQCFSSFEPLLVTVPIIAFYYMTCGLTFRCWGKWSHESYGVMKKRERTLENNRAQKRRGKKREGHSETEPKKKNLWALVQSTPPFAGRWLSKCPSPPISGWCPITEQHREMPGGALRAIEATAAAAATTARPGSQQQKQPRSGIAAGVAGGKERVRERRQRLAAGRTPKD